MHGFSGAHARRGTSLCLLAAAMLLGRAALGSSLVVISGRGATGTASTRGQWGAEGYPQHGWTFKRVLAHYYPHTEIASAPTQPVRVLLAKGEQEVTVGSASPFVLVDARGRITIHVPARGRTLGPRGFDSAAACSSHRSPCGPAPSR